MSLHKSASYSRLVDSVWPARQRDEITLNGEKTFLKGQSCFKALREELVKFNH